MPERGQVPTEFVFAALAVTVALLLGVAIVGPIVADMGEIGGGLSSYEDDLIPSADSVTLSGTNVSAPDVHQSLNDSARVEASDSITGDSPALDDTWAVSTWVQVANASGTRQIVNVDGRQILVHNGSANQWECWYYDDAAGETYRASVTATTPGQWTNLQCGHDGTTLTLRRNATAATDAVITDSANATSAQLIADNLDGQLDETRLFNATLTASEQSDLYQTPTAPLPSADRESRIMYDTYKANYGGSIPAYIQGATYTESGAEKVPGLTGQAAAEGTDWSISGDTISLLNGGTLDGAPVVFVSWSAEGGISVDVADSAADFISLAALLPMLIVAIIIIRQLQ